MSVRVLGRFLLTVRDWSVAVDIAPATYRGFRFVFLFASMFCTNINGGPRFLLTRFCCCCSLRTGTLVIASLEFVIIAAVLVLQMCYQKMTSGAAAGMVLEIFVHLLVACLLIHGVRKHQPFLVWGWVWMRCVLVVTDLANYVVKVAYSQILGAVVLAVLFTAALTYNILVVRSYAYTMSTADTTERLDSISEASDIRA